MVKRQSSLVLQVGTAEINDYRLLIGCCGSADSVNVQGGESVHVGLFCTRVLGRRCLGGSPH